ncbi:MAG: TIGR04086 family membrane protein [Acidimicrobiales bacterium]
MGPGLRAVLTGAGVALALSLPAALAAQVIDALHDGDDTPAAALLLVPVVLAGALLGGLAVGRRAIRRPHLAGAAAGALAIAVVQAIGVARRLIAEETVTWSAVPVTIAVGAALGALGAALTAQRAGRKRP